MSWRLTPEERRIIEQTKREGEELYASQTPAQKREQKWKSIVVWVGIVLVFVALAMLGSRIGTLIAR